MLTGLSIGAITVVVTAEETDLMLAEHLARAIVVVSAGVGAHAAAAVAAIAADAVVAIAVVITKRADSAITMGVVTTVVGFVVAAGKTDAEQTDGQEDAHNRRSQ